MKSGFLNCLLSLCFFFCVACERGFHEKEIEGTFGMINIEFSLNVSDQKLDEVMSRSNTVVDRYIDAVDVLVFDENRIFIERIRLSAADLVEHNNGISFSLRLEATPARRIVHVVTNGYRADTNSDRLPFSSLQAGMSEDACMSLLKTSDFTDLSLMENVTPVIMWGRAELNGVSIMTKVEGLKLLRTTACIQINKIAATIDNGLSDFEIQGMTIHNYSGNAYVAPADYLLGGEVPLVPNPSGGQYIADYAKAWNLGATPSLFVYERICSESDYMGVIIKASYKGHDGYYKIVMTDINGVPLSVIRNHRYLILIRSVNAPGYATIETAISSAPSNALQIEVVNDDAEYPFIVADSQYQMALSNNLMTLSGNASETTLAKVYSSKGVLPRIQIYPQAANAWLNCSVQDIGNNQYQIRGLFTNSSSPVEANVKLICDNLIQEVSVKWNPLISNSSDQNSYVIDLIDANSSNWNVSLNSTEKWLFLHPELSSPSSFDGLTQIDGMVKSLNSVVASKAYLHLGKGSDRTAVIIVSSFKNGKSVYERLVIQQ